MERTKEREREWTNKSEGGKSMKNERRESVMRKRRICSEGQ